MVFGILFGEARTALWAAVALVAVIVVAGVLSGLVAIFKDKDFEIAFSLRPPVIRWKVTSNGETPRLVEDGRSSDEAAIVRDEDNGELAVPIEEHSAVR